MKFILLFLKRLELIIRNFYAFYLKKSALNIFVANKIQLLIFFSIIR
jgi:hypothetical protein